MEIKFIDGYQISLVPDKGKTEDSFNVINNRTGSPHKKQLWFSNVGGYDPRQLNELHEFGLFVAETGYEAMRLAKQRLLTGVLQKHNDDNFMINSIDGYHSITSFPNWIVALTLDPKSRSQNLIPDWFGFLRIDNCIQKELKI